jgi:hypothetical protein
VIFERIGGRWLWPFIVLGLGLLYHWAGSRSHRLSGQSQQYPFLASIALAAMAFGAFGWLLLTAANWSPFEASIALFALSAAVIPALIGYVAYCRLWFRLYNGSVEAVVLKALPGGKEPLRTGTEIFEKSRSQSEFRKIAEQQAQNLEWGSHHCLSICKRVFTDRKRSILRNSVDGALPTEDYDLCLDTGEDLIYYYRLRWPGPIAVPGGFSAAIPFVIWRLVDLLFSKVPKVVIQQDWARTATLDLSRQLLTIWLQGSDMQREPHQTSAARWIAELDRSPDPYYRFLSECFDLGRGVRDADITASIEGALSRYAAMRTDTKSRGRHLSERLICQYSWLALAHRSLRPQPCYDAWMAMRRDEGESPHLPESVESDPDAALLMARKFLRSHYENWARETHHGWRQGLEGSARMIRKE